MGLFITRREGESILLKLRPDADHQEVIRQLMDDGIEITVSSIKTSQVKIGVHAPRGISIARADLFQSLRMPTGHPQKT